MFLILEMVVIGGLTGILSGLLGVGGGFIMVPLLNGAGFSMREAAGLSILYVAFTVGAGAFRHVKLGTVDAVLTLLLLAGATPMVLLGALYTTILPNSVLELIFAFVVLATTVAYWGWGRKEPASGGPPPVSNLPRRWRQLSRQKHLGGEELVYQVNFISAAGVGACTGFLSGLLGVGGGWLLVPLLRLSMRIPLPVAIGTSLSGILLPAAVGAISHWRLGNIPLEGSLPLILSGMLGSQLGAILAVRLPHVWLERCLLSLLAIASAYMFARGFGFL